MKIAIYAAADNETGMGHVVRMSHLIDLFKARGHHVDIVTNGAGQKYFASRGHHAIDMKDKRVGMATDIAIMDYMITDNEFLQALRPGVKKLVVIVGAGHTITPETRWIADLIIYQCPDRSILYNIVPGEKIISGLDHLILHPKYASPIVEKDRLVDFVAYFGGDTLPAFATDIVEGLRDNGFTVDWVGQPGAIWERDLYEALSTAQCFVGTMGMVTYEALNRKTRPIVFSRSEDHLEIAQQLVGLFHIGNLGMLPYGPLANRDYIRQLEEEYGKPPIRDYPKIDGKGVYRVAREILK